MKRDYTKGKVEDNMIDYLLENGSNARHIESKSNLLYSTTHNVSIITSPLFYIHLENKVTNWGLVPRRLFKTHTKNFYINIFDEIEFNQIMGDIKKINIKKVLEPFGLSKDYTYIDIELKTKQNK